VHKLRISASVISVLFVASAVQAITYVVPTDRDLVRRADAIIVATGVASHSQFDANGAIVTIATLRIDDVLKGGFGRRTEIDLVEMGGFVGKTGRMIPGSPRYEDGKQYLVFLRRTAGGWATYGMGLGRFETVTDLHGRALFTRGGAEAIFGWDETTGAAHVEQLRDAVAFDTFVRTIAGNPESPARADYVVRPADVILQSFPQFAPKPADVHALYSRTDYMLTPSYFRWQTPTATFAYCCSPYTVPGGLDGPGAISSGTANWTGAGAGINYTRGSPNAAANKGFTQADGINAVLFNDPNNEIPAGVAAIGGISSGSCCYMLSDGVSYYTTNEVDVVVGKSFSTNQPTFVGVMTHELGHTLGFRHSNQKGDDSQACAAPLPCTTNAVMNSVVAFGLQSLQQWDLDAAQTVYGSGPPPCTAPTINTQPAGTTISSAQSTQLSVAATGGTTPYTYQWYQGNPTGTAIGGQTQSTITVSPTTTTVYYVTVTSACGGTPAQSNTATVTVGCVAPSISLQPASSSSISSGQTVSLSMDYSGTTGTVTWYQGALLNRTSPVGTTKNFTSTSLSSNTSFWAEIVNSCGSAQTSLANVTVNQPTCPTITLNPAPSTTISSGQNVSLSMGYTGSPGSVTWYQGALLNRNSPVGSGQSFTSNALSASTSFWAEIVNGCGSAQTSLANVTVQPGGGCTTPVITLQPASVTIATGTSTQLFIGFTGTPGTITWYQGAVGTRTTPVGSGQTYNTPNLTANTTYWAEIINICTPNGVQSVAATVTVTQNPPPCTAPSITTQPANAAVTVGGAASFTVGASGTAPLVYQWYQGAKGDTAKPVGTNSPNFSSDTITGNTSFWVRVTNTCSGTQSADSNAASVTATAARRRPVRH
jgi:hypothetical protein